MSTQTTENRCGDSSETVMNGIIENKGHLLTIMVTTRHPQIVVGMGDRTALVNLGGGKMQTILEKPGQW